MFENTFSHHQSDDLAVSEFFSKVYGWMAAALALSAAIAWYAAGSEAYINFIAANTGAFYGLLLVELALVVAISWGINKLSTTMASALFIIYAALNGLTLSTLFLIYTTASIGQTLLVTGGVFGAMSLYGYTTKKDLSGWGGFLFMSLIGLILASVVNIWLNSHMIQWITTYAGVIIFTGLTAYDTQKLKHMANAPAHMLGKMAILGALQLYLDFINLFIYLLRIFGDRR